MLGIISYGLTILAISRNKWVSLQEKKKKLARVNKGKHSFSDIKNNHKYSNTTSFRFFLIGLLSQGSKQNIDIIAFFISKQTRTLSNHFWYIMPIIIL